jgi:hypothetical protein
MSADKKEIPTRLYIATQLLAAWVSADVITPFNVEVCCKQSLEIADCLIREHDKTDGPEELK